MVISSSGERDRKNGWGEREKKQDPIFVERQQWKTENRKECLCK